MSEAGLHRSSFKALARIGTPGALVTAVKGISHLIVPHVTCLNPTRRGQPHVIDSLPEVSSSLQELAQSAGILKGPAETLTSILLGFPRQLDSARVDESILIQVSPILGRVALESSEIGAQDAYICVNARDALMRGLTLGIDRSQPRGHAIEMMRRNIVTMAKIDRMMSGMKDADPEMVRELLRRLEQRNNNGNNGGAVPQNRRLMR